ncbi:hypothetical protein MtrunA17_Chr3g0130361 [Medicago truncatula]|uniref:Transmembrane protein n=2 Tax=Medicago truncatula TaxID=3880 RepID=A0A396J0R2_MEDTR|nr:uncharacterized protein LOC11430449 isoform X2 [Medicago truncatula]RHN69955.1 hypothetical protein MtrunA17_Chr3g0130361 [Medicago truncatula]
MDLTSHSLLLKTTITFLLFSLVSKTMSYSTFQTHTPENTDEGSKEFSFWTSPNTIIKSLEKCDGHDIQLRSNETQELNNHHQCSIVSEPSRSKDILEGKKELMEMIQDMPESSYELSFQDMVVEQHQVPETETEPVYSKFQQPQQKKLNKNKKKNKKENKSNRHGKMLRVESMDSETFLLKMFFPISFDWMKKTTKVQNGSEVEQKDKEWRIKRFFSEDRQNTSSSSTSRSNSNDKSRYVDRSFSLSEGCFPFLYDIKSKVKKLGGGWIA